MSDAVIPASDVPFPARSLGPLSKEEAAPAAGERRLRLWPGVVLVLLGAALMFVPGWVAPGTMAQFMLSFWGPILCAAPSSSGGYSPAACAGLHRLVVLAAYAGSGVAALLLCHPTFYFGLLMFSLPLSMAAWVVWLLVSFSLSWPVRRLGLLAVFLVCGGAPR